MEKDPTFWPTVQLDYWVLGEKRNEYDALPNPSSLYNGPQIWYDTKEGYTRG